MTKEEMRARLKSEAPDCGDNSCQFATSRGGMRTNGGCRCGMRDVRDVKLRLYVRLLQLVVKELLEEEDLTAKLDNCIASNIRLGEENTKLKSELGTSDKI